MVKRRSELWYRKRLEQYFIEHYGQYEGVVAWYVDPAINQWEFVISELGLTILLTCDDNGKITEGRRLT